MSFRYLAGYPHSTAPTRTHTLAPHHPHSTPHHRPSRLSYTPAPNTTKAAATARVLLLDATSGKVLKVLLSTPPLGNYSWDDFKEYSPPIAVHATGLDLPNESPIVLAIEVRQASSPTPWTLACSD